MATIYESKLRKYRIVKEIRKNSEEVFWPETLHGLRWKCNMIGFPNIERALDFIQEKIKDDNYSWGRETLYTEVL